MAGGETEEMANGQDFFMGDKDLRMSWCDVHTLVNTLKPLNCTLCKGKFYGM